ncbi:MAG: endolytic transglycosylase MltG [Chitinophagaceae bacterium]|nr:endolytic transglycosylase MltG [Chitinophagaceae bacterium]MBK8605330.1 endolytic transglycosylase MltG [Chitinophagaceae bacterium]MBP7316089.1 endolytic transglycosylase MltG [Chitinophagaceae bacterium]HQX97823.1 endolytic transglycosylase MltG [Chitinophagaceae bacterium]HQZ50167.1 endolytic transglycosylase MltG [Chitinophagaceae bacterium]
MKKRIFYVIVLLILIAGAFVAYKFFGPATTTPSGEFFYIKTGATYADVKNELVEKKYINSTTWFDYAKKILRFNTIKPGRYKITKGMSLFKLVRMLRSGDQSKLNLVITKIRTREDLAKKVGNLFEFDSLQMINLLNNNEKLKEYGLDTNTVMAVVMPYTYSEVWNSKPESIFEQFLTAYKKFWNDERKVKADSLKLTPLEVSTIASIVEEETNKKADKYNVASTYLNRVRIGMKLQADPTVKFAMKNFPLKRVTGVHLKTDSPFNTYMYAGIPPGPICTPSIESIDAVLDAPKTDYLYFVASHKFDGTSIFTSNYNDHLKYARMYQQELTRRMDSTKKAKENQ